MLLLPLRICGARQHNLFYVHSRRGFRNFVLENVSANLQWVPTILKVQTSRLHPTEKLQNLFHRKFWAFTALMKDKFRSCINVVIPEVCFGMFIRISDKRLFGVVFFLHDRWWQRSSRPFSLEAFHRLHTFRCTQNNVRFPDIPMLIIASSLLLRQVEHWDICSSTWAE